jgi:hypothetical protein
MVEHCRFALMSNPIYSDYIRRIAVGAGGVMRFPPPVGEDERHCMTFSARDFTADIRHGKNNSTKDTQFPLASYLYNQIHPHRLNPNATSRVRKNSEAEERRLHTHLFGSDLIFCLGAPIPDFSNIIRRLIKLSRDHTAGRFLKRSCNGSIGRRLRPSGKDSRFGIQILLHSGG